MKSVEITTKSLRDENDAEMVQLVQTAPPGYIDASLVEMAKKWSAPPKAIEVLEVLDKAIHENLTSSLGEVLIEAVYNNALERENTSHVEVVKNATWRPEAERTDNWNE